MKPDWSHSQRAEDSYFADIMRILREAVSGRVPLIGVQEFIDLWSRQAAERMVVGRLDANSRTWRQAAQSSMRGQFIYEALQKELAGPVGSRVQELIQRNAALIQSLPVKVREQVAAKQAQLAFAGSRSTVAPEAVSRLARWHARLIARTEVSKATTALTQARSEELNLQWYVWRTSKDARVRESHKHVDGVLFRWDDPPSPERLVHEGDYGKYAPGNTFNCRCYPEPLLRLDQVAWPHKTYYGGVIRPMTLAAFRSINRLPRKEIRIAIAA